MNFFFQRVSVMKGIRPKTMFHHHGFIGRHLSSKPWCEADYIHKWRKNGPWATDMWKKERISLSELRSAITFSKEANEKYGKGLLCKDIWEEAVQNVKKCNEAEERGGSAEQQARKMLKEINYQIKMATKEWLEDLENRGEEEEKTSEANQKPTAKKFQKTFKKLEKELKLVKSKKSFKDLETKTWEEAINKNGEED